MAKKLILWCAVIMWMGLIFAFSAQPATQSDELSMGLAGKILDFISGLRDVPVFSFISDTTFDYLVSISNFCIRKLAHFAIFAVLAILVYNLFVSYDMSCVRSLVLSALVCLLYAVSDEIHQFFVPGRACQIRDVVIDFCGSITSLIVTYLFSRMRKKIS